MAKRDRDERGKRHDPLAEKGLKERIVELSRVTRVTKGGKRMRFRALVVVGDGKGRVGFGIAKGADVQMSVGKATRAAERHIITVPIVRESIPHAVRMKYGAARIMLKPAPPGTGIKAGGAVRVVFELAGVPNISAKILGSANKLSNVKATFLAIESMATGPRPRF